MDNHRQQARRSAPGVAHLHGGSTDVRLYNAHTEDEATMWLAGDTDRRQPRPRA